MSIEETTETWVRMRLFCDRFGGEPFERIVDIAPTAEGARKAIFNAAVNAAGLLSNIQ
jgi:hypothetical protein